MNDRKRKHNDINFEQTTKKIKPEFHFQFNPHFNPQYTNHYNYTSHNDTPNDNIENVSVNNDIQQKEIKILKKNQKKLEIQNLDLSSQIDNLKLTITNLESMYESLYSEMLDIHRQYFNQTTPINPDTCQYLN